ncbi:MAG: GFA family protein [Alphaproteobacteria bacterium]|nr:GFA family protein [Alphaproteobacteria bacterium]
MRSSYCHCRHCQKAHGAPFRSRARVAAADFRFLAGEQLVSLYASTRCTHRADRVGTVLFGDDEVLREFSRAGNLVC